MCAAGLPGGTRPEKTRVQRRRVDHYCLAGGSTDGTDPKGSGGVSAVTDVLWNWMLGTAARPRLCAEPVTLELHLHEAGLLKTGTRSRQESRGVSYAVWRDRAHSTDEA